jgi:hypothetical protein
MTSKAWLFAFFAITAGPAHASPLTFDAALHLADQSAPSLQAKADDLAAARSSAR